MSGQGEAGHAGIAGEQTRMDRGGSSEEEVRNEDILGRTANDTPGVIISTNDSVFGSRLKLEVCVWQDKM